MTSFLMDADLARLAIICGVVFGVLAYNRFGITAGGAIVPGYLALFVPEPSHIVSTFGIALLTYVIVQKWLRPTYMLWGSRLFEMEILVAFVLQVAWMSGLWLFMQETPVLSIFTTVGFVLPGIIAHDMGRQGVMRTTQITLACTAVVFVLIMIVTAIRNALGIPTVMPTTGFAYENLTFVMTIGFSLIAVIALRKSPLRGWIGTGGFVTAAYLVMLLGKRPIDILIILAGAAVTYVIVTQILMKQAIIFGRSKMAAMILVGMLLTWMLEFGLQAQFGYTPWPGFYVIVPLMMALLANDSQRRGPIGTLTGTFLAMVIVYSGVQLTSLLI